MTYTEQQRRPKCIYIIRMYGSDFYKIGVAADVAQRIRLLQNGNPVLLVRVWQSDFCDSKLAHRVEHFIHGDYRYYRMSAPHQREWFRLTQDQVRKIQEQISIDLSSGLSDGLLLDEREA